MFFSVRFWLHILIFFTQMQTSYSKELNSERANLLELLSKALSVKDNSKKLKCLEGKFSILSEKQENGILRLCIDPTKKELDFHYREGVLARPVTGTFSEKELLIKNAVKNLKLESFKGSVGASLHTFIFDVINQDREGAAIFFEKYNLESAYREDFHEIALIPKSNAHKVKFIKMSFNSKRDLEVFAIQMQESLDQYIFFVEKQSYL